MRVLQSITGRIGPQPHGRDDGKKAFDGPLLVYFLDALPTRAQPLGLLLGP